MDTPVGHASLLPGQRISRCEKDPVARRLRGAVGNKGHMALVGCGRAVYDAGLVPPPHDRAPGPGRRHDPAGPGDSVVTPFALLQDDGSHTGRMQRF